MEKKVVHMVLSEEGPLKNPQRDTSAVKEELKGDGAFDHTALVATIASEKYPKAAKKEENPFKDFAAKYYIDDYAVALALAQEKSREHPGKKYFIAKSVTMIVSEVKEPDVYLMADD